MLINTRQAEKLSHFLIKDFDFKTTYCGLQYCILDSLRGTLMLQTSYRSFLIQVSSDMVFKVLFIIANLRFHMMNCQQLKERPKIKTSKNK